MWRGAALLAITFAVALIPSVTAQMPGSVLTRVLYLRVGNQRATAFTLEHNGKQYLITARHVISTLPKKRATIQVFRTGDWHDITVDILEPENKYVDVAVLVIPFDLSPRSDIAFSAGGVSPGQDVYFLGFPEGLPEGLHSLYGSEYLAFVKKGALSGIDSSDPTEIVLYIDGFNNPGFSGGPVAFRVSRTNKFQIAGVVSGYRFEQARVRVAGGFAPTKVLVNSGILVAYEIKHAIDVIERAGRKE